MSEVYTNWTKATTSPHEAMMGLLSCLNSGKNAWIETRKNGDQAHPICIKNPELDNPFNWTMAYGIPRNPEALASYKYFNETERDLTYNWTACFGEKEAIKKYQEDGTLSDAMFRGIGICHPVRIEDADRYRKEIAGDGYKHGYWATCWKPKDGIHYYVLDKSIGEVFVVCYDNSTVDKKDAARKAAQFLTDYAARMEGQGEV